MANGDYFRGGGGGYRHSGSAGSLVDGRGVSASVSQTAELLGLLSHKRSGQFIFTETK